MLHSITQKNSSIKNNIEKNTLRSAQKYKISIELWKQIICNFYIFTFQEINKLMGTLPPAIQALTGVDLTGVRHSQFPCHSCPSLWNIFEPQFEEASKMVGPHTTRGVGGGSNPQRGEGGEFPWSRISLTSPSSRPNTSSPPVGPLHLHH